MIIGYIRLKCDVSSLYSVDSDAAVVSDLVSGDAMAHETLMIREPQPLHCGKPVLEPAAAVHSFSEFVSAMFQYNNVFAR